MAILAALVGAGGRAAGMAQAAGGAAAGAASPAASKTLKLAEESFKFTKQNAKAVGKTAGVSFSIAALLKQSQIFTGVVGSIFQIIGAFIDIMLLPLVPVVTPIIKAAGKILGSSAQFMSKKPTELAMQVFKMIPIVGGIILAIDIVQWLKGWLSGTDGPIMKIKSSVTSFFQNLPLNVSKVWTEIKLWGVTKILELLTKIDDTWNAVTAWLGAIEWDLKIGTITPFSGVSNISSPVSAIIDALTPIQANLEGELKKINESLDKVVTVDGIKIRGEFAYEMADQIARNKGGENTYQGFNTTTGGHQDQFRMLMGGEDV